MLMLQALISSFLTRIRQLWICWRRSLRYIQAGEYFLRMLETRTLTELFLISLRPRLPMVNELMGWDWNFGFMDYGACVLLIHSWTAV